MAAWACPTSRAKYRALRRSPGGEQKRLVLEALLRGPDEVLLLDEPDNYLDVPARSGWRRLHRGPRQDRSCSSATTASCSTTPRRGRHRRARRGGQPACGRIRAASRPTTRPGRTGSSGFEELRRRWDEEHAKLKQLVLHYKIKAEYNDGMASQYRAAQTRLRKFEEAGPPTEQPREQQVSMRLTGGRTGKRAVVCEQLELTGPDAALRPRGLVRRAGRGARVERLGQVALPAAAGPGRIRPRRRAPAGGGHPDQARAAHRQGQARRACAAGLVRADPRAPRAGRPHAARDPAPGRRRRTRPRRHGPRGRPPGCSTATSSRTPRSRSSSR